MVGEEGRKILHFFPLRCYHTRGWSGKKSPDHLPDHLCPEAKKLCLRLPRTIFPLLEGLAAPPTLLLSWGASPPGPAVLNFSEYDPCGTCYSEVYTTFGPENRASV